MSSPVHTWTAEEIRYATCTYGFIIFCIYNLDFQLSHLALDMKPAVEKLMGEYKVQVMSRSVISKRGEIQKPWPPMVGHLFIAWPRGVTSKRGILIAVQTQYTLAACSTIGVMQRCRMASSRGGRKVLKGVMTKHWSQIG